MSACTCGHPAYFHQGQSCDYDTDDGRCGCGGYVAADATEHECGPECWYVAKYRGRHYRMRNRCTGAWDGWETAKPDAYSRQRMHHYMPQAAVGVTGEATK